MIKKHIILALYAEAKDGKKINGCKIALKGNVKFT